jgi:Ankyrin repeat
VIINHGADTNAARMTGLRCIVRSSRKASFSSMAQIRTPRPKILATIVSGVVTRRRESCQGPPRAWRRRGGQRRGRLYSVARGVGIRILEHGAYPNAQDLLGRTPLHRGSIEGYVGVVRVLLEYGANARAQDILNRAPLHRASEE